MEMSFIERVLVNSPFFDIWRRWTIKRVFGFVHETKGAVLEIGCGKGTTTLEIARKLPNARITGVEYDPIQVRIAKQKIRKEKRISIEQGDATNLRFKSNSFTAVFSFLTFHHIKEWKKAIKECHRVLKKGGSLYVDDLELKPFPRIQHFFFPTEGVFSRSEFITELKNAGFRIISVKGRYKFSVQARK